MVYQLTQGLITGVMDLAVVNNSENITFWFCFGSHQDSAKDAVKNSKRVFTELVKLIEKRSNEVIEKIKAQEKADLDQGAKLQDKLEEEITQLKKREGVLDTLLQTDDNIHFLQVQPPYAM